MDRTLDKNRVELSKMESITDETNNHFVNDKNLEILLIAPIQVFKRNVKEKKFTG